MSEINKRRNCSQVILEMISEVPDDNYELIDSLNWNYYDSLYKAPEETLQWEWTQRTLEKHIKIPTKDWEFKVLSIFTQKSVNELRDMLI